MTIDLSPYPPMPPETRPIPHPDDPRRSVVGYVVGRDGTVWGLGRRTWERMRTRTLQGHVEVRLIVDDTPRYLGVGSLVLRAWVGPRPLGYETLHFPDRDPVNNRLENLRWAPRGVTRGNPAHFGSPGEGDAARFGPPKRGSDHPQSVLTETDIPEIRRLYRGRVSMAEIAERYGVVLATIQSVLNGKTWAHVPDPDGPVVIRAAVARGGAAATAKLDSEDAAEIRRLAPTTTVTALARRFGVSRGAIRNVIKGRSWKEDSA